MEKIIISLLLALVLLMGCKEVLPDVGGQGADVDATNYYTKSEVDALIDGLQGGVNSSIIAIAASLPNCFYSIGGMESNTEDRAMTPIPASGILKNFSINVFENDINTAFTVIIRLERNDTLLSIPVGLGEVGVLTCDQEITVEKNERISLSIYAPSATDGSEAYINGSMIFKY